MSVYYRSRYRRWHGPGSVPRPVLVVGAALVIAGVTGGVTPHHHHHHRGAVIPAGSSYTPRSWAVAFLSVARLRDTNCNRAAVVAWEGAEGGHWRNLARYNPLDTTYAGPSGSWLANGKVTTTINSVGVRAYDSWRTGLEASAITLHNGRYGPILAAFRAGNNAQAVAISIASSPWGTGPFTPASC